MGTFSTLYFSIWHCLTFLSVEKIGFSESTLCPSIKPGKAEMVSFPQGVAPEPAAAECWLTISLRTKSSTAWADVGHEVAWCQHLLNISEAPYIPAEIHGKGSELRLVESKIMYQVKDADCTFTFDKASGKLAEWIAFGQSILSSPPSITVWRAPTDNDLYGGNSEKWEQFFLPDMRQGVRSIRIVPFTQGRLRIVVEAYISPPVRDWGFASTITYTIWSSGAVQISYHLKPQGFLPPLLPRIGIEMGLEKDFTSVHWFGRGPEESYGDKKNSQKIGLYAKDIDSMHTPYEIPQENGNRADTRWMTVSNGQGTYGMRTSRVGKEGNEIFDFAVHHYTATDLANAKHPCELVRRDEVMLRLDVDHSGLGTAACGPGVLEAYQVACREMEFSFMLEPIFTMSLNS